MSTNSRVKIYAESIGRLLAGEVKHFCMDDGGLRIEWQSIWIRVYPPDDEEADPDTLQVVLHHVDQPNYISSHFVTVVMDTTLTEIDPILSKEIESHR